MDKNKEKKKKKRKNGIWFNNTDSIDAFAASSAKSLEKTIENIIFYSIVIPLQLLQTAGVFAIAIYNDAFVDPINNFQKDVYDYGNPYILFYQKV